MQVEDDVELADATVEPIELAETVERVEVDVVDRVDRARGLPAQISTKMWMPEK
jgi:hypothetical protein